MGYLGAISGKVLNKQPTAVVESDLDLELTLNKNSRMHMNKNSQTSFKSLPTYSSAASPIYVSSESSRSSSSHFTYDSEEPLANVYQKNFKWCICAEDSRATSDSKMCDECDQWYHLKCLSYSTKAIEQFTSPTRRSNKEFICPVCKEDEVISH